VKEARRSASTGQLRHNSRFGAAYRAGTVTEETGIIHVALGKTPGPLLPPDIDRSLIRFRLDPLKMIVPLSARFPRIALHTERRRAKFCTTVSKRKEDDHHGLRKSVVSLN
jgi:hypothetical protein